MRKLIFSMNVSLDGFMEDENGNFGFTNPDAEVHQHHNDKQRNASAHVLGRRLYETMVYWETDDPDWDEVSTDFANVWRALPKYVVSTTLTDVRGATLLRDPEAEIAKLKEGDGGPVYIGGAETAARFAGLVDELDVYLCPVIVAGGKPAFPLPLQLELLGSHTFQSGVVYNRYAVVR